MQDAWGVTPGYHDIAGVWHETPDEVRRALHRAMRVDPRSHHPPDRDLRVIRPGQSLAIERPGELILEDGTVLSVDRELPPDLPFGYHTLSLDGSSGPATLIVSPGRCALPQGLYGWGWAVQLYAARSNSSWGIGDLDDLERLGRWASSLGAGLLLVNPLCAAAPLDSQEASPYYPSSRRYRNPLYLSVEAVPGAAEARVDLERLASAGRALNRTRRIDRDAVYRLKMEALVKIWPAGRRDPAFEGYRREQGESLTQYATYCALAEQHRCGWRGWPSEYRHPASAAVARFARDYADRVSFHEWVQWLLDQQVARASSAVRVMHDLPIGVDPNGVDAWAWQEMMALDVAVGAPPDPFNTMGQDWGVPPFIPHNLFLGYQH